MIRNTVFVLLAVLTPAIVRAAEGESDVRANERVLFFPTPAVSRDAGESWQFNVQTWVFQPEEDSLKRRLLLASLRTSLGLGEDAASSEIFTARLRPFLVDNERGRRIVIRIGDETYALEATAANGQSSTQLTIPATRLAKHVRQGRVEFQAVLPTDDRRVFRGETHLIEAQGPSVISDIDDTIKLSNVLDKSELVRNTFLRPLEPVEGMADVYRQWRSEGARFHFVSASPWQLYEPLDQFARESRFPDATFHLRPFRLSDGSLLAFLGDARNYKLNVITRIMEMYPERKFVLVGDTGEQDPEVYGEIARRRPEQVTDILLRDVTREPRTAARYVRAMDQVPEAKWRIFQEAREIANLRLRRSETPK